MPKHPRLTALRGGAVVPDGEIIIRISATRPSFEVSYSGMNGLECTQFLLMAALDRLGIGVLTDWFLAKGFNHPSE